MRNADIKVWANEIHSVGGYIGYAHPFRNRGYIKNPDEIPDISIVDGIEGYNMFNDPSENEKAVRIFANSKIAITAGSDLHCSDFDNAYGIGTNCRIPDSSALAKVLLSRDFSLYLGER